MQFSIYYQTPETGEYLCRVVMATAGIAEVAPFQKESAPDGESGAEVILLEYQEHNAALEDWLVQAAGMPAPPEIFLFVKEASPQIIWKARKLGAREIFCNTLSPGELQAALVRLNLGAPGSSAKPLNRFPPAWRLA